MTEKTFIDLLRHGETENSGCFNGSTDNPLTIEGRLQMQASIEKASTSWQHIVTSPLIRCASFAETLSNHLAIPLIQDTRLQEIHFGQWEGRSAKTLMQTDTEALSLFWQNPLHNPPPQAEHLLDFEQRVLIAWHNIKTQFYGKKILLVTHSGVIRIILCHVLQHPIERLQEFEVEYAALKRIQIIKQKNIVQASVIPI